MQIQILIQTQIIQIIQNAVVIRPILPAHDHRVGKFQGTLGRFYESFAPLLITHSPGGTIVVVIYIAF